MSLERGQDWGRKEAKAKTGRNGLGKHKGGLRKTKQDPAKQKKGGPCAVYEVVEAYKWYVGPLCTLCYKRQKVNMRNQNFPFFARC